MAVEDDVLRRLARSSGLTRTEVRRFLRLEVVTSVAGELDPALILRLRRARRLRRDLGLSPDAVEIILRLLERLEALEGREDRGPTPRVL